MNQETVIWATIVLVLAVALIGKTIAELRKDKKTRIIEMGTEDEIFYCPGDVRYNVKADKD